MTSHVEDPFQDPTPVAELTLPVGKDASLTLATESLIILDEALNNRHSNTWCGLPLLRKAIPTRAIPYFNILWAEIQDLQITIRHASPVSSSQVRISTVTYAIDKSSLSLGTAFCARLLDRAYGASLKQKRIKVIVNPFGGKGHGRRIYKSEIGPVFEAAKCHLDVVTTDYSGHAKDIAQNINPDDWDVVACVSGDGLPHEVFNGLAKKDNATEALRKIAVVQLPAGSGNAMSLNLNGTDSPSMAALCVIKGLRMPLDLVSVTQEDRRTLSFLSQSFGIVADVDLGTDSLRWMGDFRFTFGFLVRLFGKTVYPCEVAVKVVDDDKTSIRKTHKSYVAGAKTAPQVAPILDTGSFSAENDLLGNGLPPLHFGTVQDELPNGWEMKSFPTMGNFYSGNMPFMAKDTNFFQAALPNDGCMDLINVDGNISTAAALRLMIAAGENKLFDMNDVLYKKIEGYRIIPRPRENGSEGYISIDGERIPFKPFQAEVHKGLGTVLALSGKVFEVSPLE